MRKETFFQSRSFTSMVASLASILCGLLLGFILLIFFAKGTAGGAQRFLLALDGMHRMLVTGFAASDKFAKVLYQAAPLIMTGLSVGFAFKTGLFNIGATGQYLIGAFCGIITAIVFQQPWWIAMLAAAAGGAVWGFFPGLFKALFNVNEVITSIMFNWIALYLVNLGFSNIPSSLANYWGASNADRTAVLSAANPSAMIPKAGLNLLLGSRYMNISIFIAIAFSALCYIVLNRTVFGYELKACGYNRNASLYAGINAKRSIVLSMVIFGAPSGVAGGVYHLAGTAQYTIITLLPAMAFTGCPVALLATSNPVGAICAALFIS